MHYVVSALNLVFSISIHTHCVITKTRYAKYLFWGKVMTVAYINLIIIFTLFHYLFAVKKMQEENVKMERFCCFDLFTTALIVGWLGLINSFVAFFGYFAVNIYISDVALLSQSEQLKTSKKLSSFIYFLRLLLKILIIFRIISFFKT